MTYAQIGSQPHKACCHIDHRPACHICANYAATLITPTTTIKTGTPK